MWINNVSTFIIIQFHTKVWVSYNRDQKNLAPKSQVWKIKWHFIVKGYNVKHHPSIFCCRFLFIQLPLEVDLHFNEIKINILCIYIDVAHKAFKRLRWGTIQQQHMSRLTSPAAAVTVFMSYDWLTMIFKPRNVRVSFLAKSVRSSKVRQMIINEAPGSTNLTKPQEFWSCTIIFPERATISSSTGRSAALRTPPQPLHAYTVIHAYISQIHRALQLSGTYVGYISPTWNSWQVHAGAPKAPGSTNRIGSDKRSNKHLYRLPRSIGLTWMIPEYMHSKVQTITQCAPDAQLQILQRDMLKMRDAQPLKYNLLWS